MSYENSASFNEIIKFYLLGLNSLDRKTLSRLRPMLAEAQAQLEFELDKFSQDQFSYRKRTVAIASINRSLNQIDSILSDGFKEAASEYYEFGEDVAKREVSTFNADLGIATKNLNKEKVSLEQNKFLINNMQASLDTYSAGVRKQVSDAVTTGVIAGRSSHEISFSLSKFLRIKAKRLQLIARTELHKIYNASKLISYSEYKKTQFPDMMKRLYHPMDNRTADDSKQLARLDPAVPLHEPFRFTYKRRLKSGRIVSDERIFMHSPDRPNDRSATVPYRPEWENIE